MYERFYNLRERPFSLSPDPDYLYPSPVHRDALSYLRYGIEGRAGFVVITGNIGCGKTTLLQTVLRGLDERTPISRIVNTTLDAREFLEAVASDFGLVLDSNTSKVQLLRRLGAYLVEQRTAGRLPLVVIDEAQNLSMAALEEVRMLSNLETEKSKLVQIVLVGQPDLRDRLARPELEQLRQRVTVSYHLQPLDREHAAAYINHRLRRAAIGVALEFPRDVTDLIHQHSHGVPRMINVIADATLLFGYGEERRVIDVALVRSAIDELQSTGVLTDPSVVRPAAAPSLAVLSRAESEVRLAERERQVAEQQRALLEEYRLLYSRTASVTRPAASPEASSPQARPRPSSATAATDPRPVKSSGDEPDVKGRVQAERAPRAEPRAPRASANMLLFREEAAEPDGWWARHWRALFGAPKPVFED